MNQTSHPAPSAAAQCSAFRDAGLGTAMTPLRTALIGALIVALGPVSLSLYSPALPSLAVELGTTSAVLSLTVTIYFFGYAFSQLLCGPLSDAYGRRPVSLAFFALYLVGSLVCLLASDITVLLTGRALQGIGVAAGAAVSRALVRDQFTGTAATRIMSLIGLMLALGPAVSPFIGGSIVHWLGWRWVFLVMVAYGVVVMVVLGFGLAETNRCPDRASAHPNRAILNYARLLSRWRFTSAGSLLGLSLGTLYALSPLTPFVLIGRLGLSPTTFGLVMLIQAGSYTLGSFTTGRLLRVVESDTVVRLGVLVLAASAIGFAVGLRVLPLSAATVMAPQGLLAFGVAMVVPGATTRALSGPAKLGGAASALTGFMQIGGGLAGSGLAALLFVDPLAAIATVPPVMLALAVLVHALSPAAPALAEAAIAPDDLKLAPDPAGVVEAAGNRMAGLSRTEPFTPTRFG